MQCYLGKACEGHQVEPWKQSVHAPSESSKTILICFSKRWPPRDRNSESRCGQYGKVRLASEQTAVHVPVLRRLAATLMRDDELGTSGTGLTAWENRVSMSQTHRLSGRKSMVTTAEWPRQQWVISVRPQWVHNAPQKSTAVNSARVNSCRGRSEF